jgi:hypothetical protein
LTAIDFEYFFKVQINWPAVCIAKTTDFLRLEITYAACGCRRGEHKLGKRTKFGLAHFSAACRSRVEEKFDEAVP